MLGLLKKYRRITSTKMENVTNKSTRPAIVAHNVFIFFIFSYSKCTLFSPFIESI
jgi:hypothetical protein